MNIKRPQFHYRIFNQREEDNKFVSYTESTSILIRDIKKKMKEMEDDLKEDLVFYLLPDYIIMEDNKHLRDYIKEEEDLQLIFVMDKPDIVNSMYILKDLFYNIQDLTIPEIIYKIANERLDQIEEIRLKLLLLNRAIFKSEKDIYPWIDDFYKKKTTDYNELIKKYEKKRVFYSKEYKDDLRRLCTENGYNVSKESVINHIKKALFYKDSYTGLSKEVKDKYNKNAMKIIKDLEKKWINPKSESG